MQCLTVMYCTLNIDNAIKFLLFSTVFNLIIFPVIMLVFMGHSGIIHFTFITVCYTILIINVTIAVLIETAFS